MTGRNVSSHFRERARESAKTKVTLALRKAHFSAASSQTGYSETSEAVSRGFTWLTFASPGSSYLGLARKVLFPKGKQRWLRTCASVCSEPRFHRSGSFSTQSIFCRSHVAEILEECRECPYTSHEEKARRACGQTSSFSAPVIRRVSPSLLCMSPPLG